MRRQLTGVRAVPASRWASRSDSAASAAAVRACDHEGRRRQQPLVSLLRGNPCHLSAAAADASTLPGSTCSSSQPCPSNPAHRPPYLSSKGTLVQLLQVAAPRHREDAAARHGLHCPAGCCPMCQLLGTRSTASRSRALAGAERGTLASSCAAAGGGRRRRRAAAGGRVGAQLAGCPPAGSLWEREVCKRCGELACGHTPSRRFGLARVSQGALISLRSQCRHDGCRFRTEKLSLGAAQQVRSRAVASWLA